VSASAAAHRAIHEQVPVSIVMTPAWHVGLGSRLASYDPWGSDYYVIGSQFGLPDSTTTEAGETLSDSVSGATWVSFSRISIVLLLLLSLIF